MNFVNFISNHGKRINRDHFLHLVQVAKTDGQIQKEEHEMLHRQGKKFGLTDPEIDDMIKSESPENYHPPYSLEDKFYELYNITELILSDEKVSEREKKMIKRYAIAAGLPDDLTESLCRILIEGVQNETDEETLLKEFRKIVRNKYRN
ncbi:MAG TPA: hypothetical protein P5257_08985 [Bacteroidales bacterium]|nr:hypothetical protein [Bacteroidales bacterium]HRT90240.1 hypothetical protein [Bacteroidales bacterium]